jgi:hypothetical protein
MQIRSTSYFRDGEPIADAGWLTGGSGGEGGLGETLGLSSVPKFSPFKLARGGEEERRRRGAMEEQWRSEELWGRMDSN